MKKLTALLLALAMMLALVACGGGTASSSPASSSPSPTASSAPADTSSDPQPGTVTDEITIGWLGTNNIVNPYDTCMAFGFNFSGSTQAFLIYDQLFYSTNEGETKSRILEDWEWIDDTTLLCHLKSGITFSNGDPLTGEDIIYTYQLMANGFFPIKFMYDFIDTENSYTEDDGLTLYLKTKACTPSAIPFLYTGIMCQEYIESVGGENIDWYDPAQWVGSGPYAPVEYVQDSYTVYELRDDYWGNAYGYEQTIGKMTVKLYGDSTSMMADYQNGLIQMAYGVSNDDYVAAMNGDYGNSGTGIVTNNFVSWLVMETDAGPCADAAVREAICYAIDTAAMTETILGELGVPNSGAFAAAMLGYTDEYQYSYDPDHAKQVLADAGYSDGEVTLTYAYKSTDPTQVSTAEMVQGYLMAVGINVELVPMDESTYSAEETVEGYSDICYYFMSNGTDDPGQFMGNWLSTGSSAIINRHGAYDEVISMTNSTHDKTVRAQYLQELQKMWYDNFDLVPLFELGTGYVYNADIFSECVIHTFSANLVEQVSIG